MIDDGLGEDKAKYSATAEATGAAINLRTQNPTTALVREALLTMLIMLGYNELGMGLKEEHAKYDPVKSVVRAIDGINARENPNYTI